MIDTEVFNVYGQTYLLQRLGEHGVYKVLGPVARAGEGATLLDEIATFRNSTPFEQVKILAREAIEVSQGLGPSRRLDERVAKEVMGYRLLDEKTGLDHPVAIYPAYSSDDKAASEVLERLTEEGRMAAMESASLSFIERRRLEPTVAPLDLWKLVPAWEICVAALRIRGLKEEEITELRKSK